MKNQEKKSAASPWLWVPTLYFAEGVPYFIVNNVSVMMLTRMGVPNGQMSFYTSLLYLPWLIKPFWCPFVDIIKTKRWWILAMQLVIVAAFVGLTLAIPHPSSEVIAAHETPISLFAVMLIIFWITAFASATHDIAADGFYMLALSPGNQSLFVGIRSTFYRISSLFGQGVLLTIAGLLETHTHDIPFAWQMTLLITSVLFGLITIWHLFFIPKPTTDCPHVEDDSANRAREIMREFGRTFATYFRKPGVLLAIVFMLVYRLPEAFLLKMINPFLVDSVDKGGLALSTETVGIVYGTIGIIMLTVGGIFGGIFASRVGLKKSMWLMAACMTLPCFSFVYLGVCQPSNIVLISLAIAVEQFGYGFGFTAYTLYMMYFSEGEFKTAHYAICTAFMAASMMLPGLVAGFLQEMLGYANFFWMVIACCLATVVVTHLVLRHIDPQFGKK